jgi:hypothetical protein
MTDPSAPPQRFNLLVMAKGSAHFASAGQMILAQAPVHGAELNIEKEGRAMRGLVTEIYIPPGCDEHCIGTLFLREI